MKQSAVDARQLLATHGARWVPLVPGTKRPRWRNRNSTPRVSPWGDYGVYIPANMVLLEADGPIGEALLAELDLPETLTVHTRKGPHLYYKLPDSIRPLPQRIRFLTEVDVITTGYAVAPGSVVGGHEYAVEHGEKIATLSRDVAAALADLLGPRRSGLSFTVADVLSTNRPDREDDDFAKDPAKDLNWRRAVARAARGSQPETLARAQRWLGVGGDGHRHQALFGLAKFLCGRGEAYEAYRALVMASPVGSKCRDKPERWLRAVWNKAVRDLAPSRGPARAAAEYRARFGNPAAAEAWLATVMASGVGSGAKHLAQLHASWVARFGLDYYCAYSIMTEWSQCSWRGIDKFLAELDAAGLLQARPRTGLPRAQATYYDVCIGGVALRTPQPPTCMTLYHMGPDLRFLSDTEIDDLLTAACGPQETGLDALPPPTAPPQAA